MYNGKYSFPQKDDPTAPLNGLVPRQFKNVIGKGHPEFSTMRQQDALEFFQWLLETIKKDEQKRSKGEKSVSQLFEFEVEERIQCTSSNKVSYKRRLDNSISLPIPLSKASNKGFIFLFKQIYLHSSFLKDEVKAYEERQRLRKENEKETGIKS